MNPLVRGLLCGVLLGAMSPTQASTLPGALLDPPVLVGEGRLSMLFWDIYTIRLYTESGRFDREQPFALSLNYLRAVDGQTIAETSIALIAKQSGVDQGKLSDWERALSLLFPDIAKGDHLVGYQDAASGSRFFLNGDPLGAITDLELSRRFFDIWLSEETSEPRLRRALLGEPT